jgi:hypothetical protein
VKDWNDPHVSGYPTFDPSFPAPNIADATAEKFYDGEFGLAYIHHTHGQTFRAIRKHELLKCYGFSAAEIKQYLSWDWPSVVHRLRAMPGRNGLSALFASLLYAEVTSRETWRDSIRDSFPPETFDSPHDVLEVARTNLNPILVMPAMVEVNRWTTIPIPTSAAWIDGTAKDPDLQLIRMALTTEGATLNKALLADKGYHKPFMEGKFEWISNLLYMYEAPKRAHLRSLRLLVVPPGLRRAVISALHASPFAGHSSPQKTYGRIIVRYWWPSLLRDVDTAVIGCGHCRLANNVNHKNQSLLQTIQCDTPFDVIFLDVWSPGDNPTKWGHIKVLTGLDCMTAYEEAAFLTKADSDSMARAAFSFVPMDSQD